MKTLLKMAAILFLFGAGVWVSAQSSTGNDEFRQIHVPDSSVVIKLWNASDPAGQPVARYAISWDGGRVFSPVQQSSYTIKLRHGDFEPFSDNAPPVEEELFAGSDTNLYIVQFVAQPLEVFREAIEKIGGEVHFFLANHAHIVRMSPEIRSQVEAMPFVRWTGPFHPAYRLEEFLRHNRASAGVLFPLERYNIMIFKEGILDKASVADRIRKLGGAVNREHAGKYLLEATLTPQQLYQVARFDEVLFIDRWGPYERDMEKARELGGANYIETMAGFTGQGVRGEIMDSGFNVGHVDFSSRPLIEHTTVSNGSHGAATSGIIFGDGTGNALGRGLLPDGQGIVADWDVASTGQPRYDLTGELVQAPYFAVFQTASVGSPRTTQYTNISADTDSALFDFDITHCQSQSNAGDQMSRPQAWAKNIISGGAVNHQDTLDRSDDCWCNGASIGPASDGRIKPDLNAFYDAIFTTTSGSPTSYTNGFGGTSGATPIICGHVGLVYQMWSEGVFGNTVNPNATVFENRCHMTTAKALLINSAFQYTFSGTNHDLTRVHQGWGFPDVRRLYDMRDKILVIDEEDVLTNLQTQAYSVSVLQGEPELKVTMTYADPPGVPASSQHRINDLTLKVTSPSGVEYWGNNGLLANNYSTPGGSANTVDTVENVFVQNPEGGSWTVEVIASEINQDSHVETPEVDADFALVVTGATPGPGFGLVADPRIRTICAPDDAVYTLDVVQFEGYTEPVTLTVDGEPAGSVVSFSSNPVTPPAAVTVTVSNTDSATPGVYSLRITGTSVDLSRASIVGLELSDVIPPTPTLTSPGNGETEVSRDPALTWDAANQALTYDVELATDAGFSAVVYSATVTDTSATPDTRLDPLTQYFWRVRANNGCGTNGFSAPFSFTTLDQPDYFTELFSGDNDLDNRVVLYVPDGTGDYYRLCGDAASQLPTDPAGGTVVPLTDDDSDPINLAQAVSLYGVDYTTMYVGSNGFITFTGSSTTTGESLSSHFNLPRISGLFDDLNPATGGEVSYKELPDRVAVTYLNVPEYNTSNANTFQIEMFFNGEIHVTYLDLAASDGLAGLSEGNGVPGDFIESDLSAAGPCADACRGDLNLDGTVNMTDVFLCAQSWNQTGVLVDMNGDGVVNTLDMVEIMMVFGACP